MIRSRVLPALLLLAAAGCGGPKEAPAGSAGAEPVGASTAAVTENRWLRGLWADDIRKACATVEMPCKGPVMENRESAWSCESATPLVAYKALFYGSAPGKIEYLIVTVTQADRPRDELPLRVFLALAGLHFEGADPQKARAWVRANIGTGGAIEFGPAKFKLAGDGRRRQLEIKASGSDW